MRKTSAHIKTPGLQLPTLSTTLKQYHRSEKREISASKPAPPTEETVDRLNDLGKTYPFCVYYREQKNDPL